MLRRLYPSQPDSFAFTKANLRWAKAQITKFPETRQASAVIPLLWRAQEQEGWLSRPAIEHIADMLDMAYIRVLEVATFYFMFQLQPVGAVAHIQVCGTTSCMICGAEDLIGVCKDKIAANPHEISADGNFSWEEVECLGSCSNAPMAQIGKDYYEDLTTERLSEIIVEFAAGKVPLPGPQNGRYATEPLAGLTSLTGHESGRTQYNASAQLAHDLGDTVKRIDGSEVGLSMPWLAGAAAKKSAPLVGKSVKKPKATVKSSDGKARKPKALKTPRKSGADDLKMIKGVGPKLEKLLNSLGFYHFDQVAAWGKDEIMWVDDNLAGFKGRASRDKWVSQAKILAKGGETEFSKRAKY
ncbi:MAG: NADH-quinone oxidoreductase subunit NuoE [Paracoccaceae bacterium]